MTRKIPNETLREWLCAKRGRSLALSKKLNCSRQYTSQISKNQNGISLEKWDQISWGMLEVENDEKVAL